MDELAYTLALHRTNGIGPTTFRDLIEHFGSASLVFENIKDIESLPRRGARLKNLLNATPWPDVEKDLHWEANASNHHLITFSDPRYPSQLAQLRDAPPVLYVKGEPDVLGAPQLAMVGTRNPTPTGVSHADSFARALVQHGLTVTSGLALGIDAASHTGTLAANGRTIAVLGTGIDQIYPRQHVSLADKIVENGALISEYPLYSALRRENFPRRNRIISGLSLGTLVIEASQRSGSLITARYANEQGREVFAIPGSIHNPQSRGCHALIKQGAKLVETINDILEELGFQGILYKQEWSQLEQHRGEKNTLDPEASLVLESLGYEPTPMDLVVQRTKLATETVSSKLLVLELHGFVQAAAGGIYYRVNHEGSTP